MDQLDEALERARRRKNLPDPVVRRLLRIQAGLTQGDVAKYLGTTAAAVSRYESGDREPRKAVMDKYVDIIQRIMNEKSSA
jgi:transcriptional regulator with XRE-family HTH domain